jgi:transcriptional regulator with XRE-family HTH domain
MNTISVPAFTRKLREVVADEPKAFAYDVGLSLSAVYNYLNGRVPATEVLFRIARYTGRPMEWFLVDETLVPGATSLGGEVGAPTSYAAAPGGPGGT